MVLQNKINFLLPSLKPYGGIRVIIELANVLVGEGYQVQLIIPDNNNKGTAFSLDQRITITKVGRYNKYFFLKIYNISRTLLRVNKLQRNEVVIITEPLQSIVLSFFRQYNLVRFLQADDYNIFNDGDLLKFRPVISIYKKLCRFSYKRIKYFLFNSDFTFRQFKVISERNDIDGNIVTPAVDHKVFKPDTLKTGTGNLKISIIARRQPTKGFKYFIDAWNILPDADKKFVEEVSVITPDELNDFHLPAKCKLYHPSSDTDLACIIKTSDIFVFTSLREGFGLPPLEAMACGCAVITSDCGGVDDFVKPEYNCLMYHPENSTALAECLRTLMSNREMREKIYGNGVTTASNYSWQNSADKLLYVLENIS